jgi:hypothetical protein
LFAVTRDRDRLPVIDFRFDFPDPALILRHPNVIGVNSVNSVTRTSSLGLMRGLP